MSRQMKINFRSVAAAGPNRRGQRRGIIDNKQIARFEEVGKIVEPCLRDLETAACSDKEAHLISRHAARFRRFGRLQFWRDRERNERIVERHHRSAPPATAMSCCAWNRPEGGASLIRRRNAGAGTSGPGRWERSTPGSASWCITVFMSPGSTQ